MEGSIFGVRKLKQNQSFQLKQDGDDDTHVEKEIQFLKSMALCKNEALLNEEHCEKL